MARIVGCTRPCGLDLPQGRRDLRHGRVAPSRRRRSELRFPAPRFAQGLLDPRCDASRPVAILSDDSIEAALPGLAAMHAALVWPFLARHPHARAIRLARRARGAAGRTT